VGEPKAIVRPDPVLVLRVTVRAPDLDGFITRYSRHLAGDRIFIFSKNPQPPGTQVRFTLQLQNGEALISGRGTVKRMQLDSGDTHRPPGMEVQFTPLDERSQTLVEFMRATRSGAAQEVAPLARAVEPSLPIPLPPPPTEPAPESAKPSLPVKPLPVKPLPAKPVRPPSVSLEVGWKVAEATVPGADAPTDVQAPPSDKNAVSAPLLTDLAKAEVAAHVASVLDAAARGDDGQNADEPATAVGPAPAMAETWRDSSAAPANGEVPANPFSEISDGAIEYFVEWSLEQSIGPRTLPQARFSDVPMVLPGDTGAHQKLDPDPLDKRKQRLLQGALFAGGLLLGGLVVGLIVHRPSTPHQPVAPPPTQALPSPLPSPSPSPSPAASPPPPSAEVALSVTSRPPGATVLVDGEAAGTTPLQAQVKPGRHEVAVQKDRYATVSQTVEAPGQLRAELRRPSAILHVRSAPSNAEVTVAGEVRGRTPVDLKLPGYESYDVRVAMPGAKPWRKKVYLGRVSNNVEATLSKAATKGPPAKR
jgi:molecular chaperone DnaK